MDHGSMNKITTLIAYIRIMRPDQWYKNFLFFIPLIYSMNLFKMSLWYPSFVGFLVLCISFGASYTINDVIDHKKDLLHPVKSRRVIPSGKIKPVYGLIWAIILYSVGQILAFNVGINFFIINLSMILLTLFYSAKLKNYFLIDSFVIAFNYILRAVAGAIVIDVSISPWLIMGIFFSALLLVFGKRKSEILFLNDDSVKHRKVLQDYTPQLLTYLITISSIAVLTIYSMYIVEGVSTVKDDRLVFTLPLIFFILIKYVNSMLRGDYKGREFIDFLIRDKQILGAIVMYAILLILLLYIFPHNWPEMKLFQTK